MYKFNHLILLYFIIIASLITANCSSSEELTDPYANKSAQEIHKEAVALLDDGRYELSTKAYEALETHFPFGETTNNGQLEIIYAYYKNQDYMQAITAGERYLRMHPFSKHTDYIYYITGIIYYEQNHNFLTNLVNINPAIRDISDYKKAFNNFEKVVKQYPNSKYAKDSKQRMQYIRNLIAENELSVSRYYIKRGAYLAASNRARYILEHLPNTPAEKPALAILEDMYSKLNVTKS